MALVRPEGKTSVGSKGEGSARPGGKGLKRQGSKGSVRPGGKAPVRLTRRGRAALVMAVALLSLAGFWLGTRAASMAAAEPVTPAQVGAPSIEVQRGDTIWTIAAAMAGEGEDPMAIVNEIKRLNGLPDSLIRIGTRLYVPGGTASR